MSLAGDVDVVVQSYAPTICTAGGPSAARITPPAVVRIASVTGVVVMVLFIRGL